MGIGTTRDVDRLLRLLVAMLFATSFCLTTYYTGHIDEQHEVLLQVVGLPEGYIIDNKSDVLLNKRYISVTMTGTRGALKKLSNNLVGKVHIDEAGVFQNVGWMDVAIRPNCLDIDLPDGVYIKSISTQTVPLLVTEENRTNNLNYLKQHLILHIPEASGEYVIVGGMDMGNIGKLIRDQCPKCSSGGFKVKAIPKNVLSFCGGSLHDNLVDCDVVCHHNIVVGTAKLIISKVEDLYTDIDAKIINTLHWTRNNFQKNMRVVGLSKGVLEIVKDRLLILTDTSSPTDGILTVANMHDLMILYSRRNIQEYKESRENDYVDEEALISAYNHAFYNILSQASFHFTLTSGDVKITKLSIPSL